MTSMTAEDKKWDKKWRAESDAGTLIEAEAIQADSKRKKAAIDVANVMAKEAQDKAKAAMKVASKKKMPAKKGKK